MDEEKLDLLLEMSRHIFNKLEEIRRCIIDLETVMEKLVEKTGKRGGEDG